MINILFPFLILSIISIFFSKKNNISLTKSFLVCILSIVFFIFIIGNFIPLYYAIYLILTYLLIIFFYIFFDKEKFKLNFYLRELLLIFIPLFILVILYSHNLFLYKYDEFSEYGIISKLLFYEEKTLNNIHDIFYKGSPHKINIMGYLNYFFLKSSFLNYKEQLLYIAQNTLNLILVMNILEFLSQKHKKVIFFIVIYLLSFILSTGFDKVYLDITAGLLIALIILNQNLNPEKNKYLIITLCMLFLFCLKTSTSIIFFGLAFIFILISIIGKNYKIVFFYLSILLCSFLIEKIYSSNSYLFKNENNLSVGNFTKNSSKILTYENKFKSVLSFSKKKFEYETFAEIIKRNYEFLSQEGIYHAKTFLIPNKIFNRLNINFNLIEIPLNIFIWFIFILILSKIANIEDKNQLYIFVGLFILFIIFYWLTILFWGWQNNLMNKDYSIEVSWQRHLGILIFALVVYLLVILFKHNNLNYVKFFFILIFLFNISTPLSLKVFFTKEFIRKDNFWSDKYNQRIEIKNLSKLITNNLKPYSTLIYSLDNKNSYFQPILNYELTNISLFNIDKFQIIKLKNLHLILEKYDKNNLYLLINEEQESFMQKNYKSREKINFSKLFSDSKIIIFKLNKT
tara:strand:+ start:417 stop:2300 length:1884 start_codon:yes stop_codon:yes gene_type:complete